ncbi:MAG: hypothetical protein R3D55_06635 [Chloroflexota bacterium]
MAAANTLVAIAPRQRGGYAMGLLLMGANAGIAIGPPDWRRAGRRLRLPHDLCVSSPFFCSSAACWSGGAWKNGLPTGNGQPETALVLGRLAARVPNRWRAAGLFLRFVANLGRTLLTPFAPLFIATLLVDGGHLNTVTGLVIGVSAATGTITAVYLDYAWGTA